MRILFLIDLWDPRIGSSVRQMYQHAECLRERGHETAVISTTTERADCGWRTVEGCEVFLIHSDYPPRFRSWVALRHRSVLGPLRGALEKFRPDVVHSHLIHSHLSYAALSEARAVGAGIVFTAHDSMTFCYQKLDCFHGGEKHDFARKDYRAHWSKCIPCQRFRFRPGRNAAIRAVLEATVDRFTVVTDEQAVVIKFDLYETFKEKQSFMDRLGDKVGDWGLDSLWEKHMNPDDRFSFKKLHQMSGISKEWIALNKEYNSSKLFTERLKDQLNEYAGKYGMLVKESRSRAAGPGSYQPMLDDHIMDSLELAVINCEILNRIEKSRESAENNL